MLQQNNIECRSRVVTVKRQSQRFTGDSSLGRRKVRTPDESAAGLLGRNRYISI
jgi:hypothetical protein